MRSLLSILIFAGLPGGLVVNDIEGHPHKPLAAAGRKATVLIFIAHDCPVSNGYAPEIARIITKYSPRKVACYIVYAESGFSAEAARKHWREYGYKTTALLDANFRLSRAVGAEVTPQAIVLSPDGKPLYKGRIDDLYVDYGKQRAAPTRHDLRETLDSVLAGKKLAFHKTKSVGCFIPWEK